MHLLLLAQWIQVLATPFFSDPSGITMVNGNLIVVDSEVNETTILDRATMFEMTTTGAMRSLISLQSFTKEATGVTYDDASGALLISDDSWPGWVHTLHPGQDLLFGTADDASISLRVRDIGIFSADIEGLALYGDELYLAAGSDATVYVVTPGPEGFDDRSVVARSIPMAPMKSVDGITIHDDVIYAVGQRRNRIYAFDLNGVPMGEQRFLEGPLRTPAGIAYDPSSRVFYIADRGVDNDDDPNEDDGNIYSVQSEFSLLSSLPGMVENLSIRAE